MALKIFKVRKFPSSYSMLGKRSITLEYRQKFDLAVIVKKKFSAANVALGESDRVRKKRVLLFAERNRVKVLLIWHR